MQSDGRGWGRKHPCLLVLGKEKVSACAAAQVAAAHRRPFPMEAGDFDSSLYSGGHDAIVRGTAGRG
jgi:hypothetical protein